MGVARGRMERAGGIEPPSSAWKTEAQPLDQARSPHSDCCGRGYLAPSEPACKNDPPAPFPQPLVPLHSNRQQASDQRADLPHRSPPHKCYVLVAPLRSVECRTGAMNKGAGFHPGQRAGAVRSLIVHACAIGKDPLRVPRMKSST